MDKPGLFQRRATWFCLGAAAMALAGGIALLAGAGPDGPPAEGPEPPVNAIQAIPLPVPPVQLTPLNRADLLALAESAADEAAGGKPAQGLGDAIGRNFLIRIPFGCAPALAGAGEGAGAEWASWNYNAETATLKLEARPERWADATWAAPIAAGMPFEAVEGFWIRRPWTTSESCPPASGPAADGTGDGAPAVQQTVGIAQFFAPETRRALRRGERPYSATLRVEDPAAVGSYRLVLGGRIAGYPDGRAVRCWSRGETAPPLCMLSVEFARVAFEDARTGKTLSEWQN